MQEDTKGEKLRYENESFRINEHKAQIFNYLAATGITLGFLVNFCAYPKAEIIRVIR
jgi:hypothetical protein